MGRRTLLRAAGVAGVAALGTLGSGAADAATAPEVEWSRAFGGGRDDLAFSVTATNDGGFAFCGDNESATPGDEDGWLVKTDAEGRKQWSRTYDEAGSDRGLSVAQNPDGTFTVAGISRPRPVSGNRGWLVKTDPDGDERWSRVYTGGSDSVVRSHVPTADGGYLLAGYAQDDGPDDAWLVKTDAEGREQWSRTYGVADSSAFEAAGDVARTADGGYVFAGRVSADRNYMWLVKVDGDGDRQWARRFGGSDYELATTVTRTADGGLALAGKVHDFSSPHARVIKTDADGAMEWSETVTGPGERSFHSLVELPDGGFAISGHAELPDADDRDGWLLRLDATGDRQWSRVFGGGDYDLSGSLVRAADGGYVVCGPTRSIGPGGFNGWLAKVASANEPPVARFDFSPTPPVAGEPTTFDASASTDPDGSVVSYEWDFDDDGTTDGTGRTATHTYGSGGERTVTLEVTDDDGATDVASETFVVHLEVDIDVRPGSETNPVNPASSGPVRVAVLPSEGFDPVTAVARETLRFGHVEDVESGGGATPTRTTVRRVRGGDEALVASFPVEETGFGDATRGPLPGVGVTDNTAVGELVGETTDGIPLFGTDHVLVVGTGRGGSGRGR